MRALLLGLAMGAVATGAGAADQFDLICTGKSQTAPEGPWSPYSARYRIDLAAGLWCVDECATPAKFAEVTPNILRFAPDVTQADSTDGSSRHHKINRVTGQLFHSEFRPRVFATGRVTWFEVDATCEPGPFSGMPAAKF